MAAVILMGGAVVAIVWACCGESTFPLDVINIEVTPDPVPCGAEGDVTISFDVVVGSVVWPDPGWELDLDTYADVYVGGNLVATVPAAPPNPGWGMSGTYSASVDVSAPAGTSSVMIVAFNGDVISVPGPDIVVEPCEVPVDMKGGSCPNSFNRAKKGVLPVAILEGGDVSLAEIDPDSITVGGVAVIAGMSIMEDSTEPPTGDPADCYDCFDAPDDYMGDGVDELVVYVDAPTLVDANPNGLADAIRDDCIELVVEGMTYDGRAIIGSDSLRIIK